MDDLYTAVSALVAGAEAQGEPAPATHARIQALAYAAAGRAWSATLPILAAEWRRAPRLTENWFC